MKNEPVCTTTLSCHDGYSWYGNRCCLRQEQRSFALSGCVARPAWVSPDKLLAGDHFSVSGNTSPKQTRAMLASLKECHTRREHAVPLQYPSGCSAEDRARVMPASASLSTLRGSVVQCSRPSACHSRGSDSRYTQKRKTSLIGCNERPGKVGRHSQWPGV